MRLSLGLSLGWLVACSDAPIPVADAAPDAGGAAWDAMAKAFDATVADAAIPDYCADKPDGTSCDDRDLCTQVDRCSSGVCIGTTPFICNPEELCERPGRCDPSTGACVYAPQPNGTLCNDESICTGMDRCQSGTCVGDPLPSTTLPCSEGICFTNVTEAAGLDWVSVDGSPDNRSPLGAAAVFFDFDGDQWPDILIGSEGTAPRLYRNLAGTFVDVTVSAGLAQSPLGGAFMGAVAADYDNDGDSDLYFLLEGANVLFANQGDGTFAAIESGAEVSLWSSTAAFGDFDRDGWLDLYVGNYIELVTDPPAGENVLYQNSNGTAFIDVTDDLQVAGNGLTLGTMWTDTDRDGDLDLFVCNDFGALVEPNYLYENANGTFTDVSQATAADIAIFCMTVAPGDYDRDGDLDYYFTNIGKNVLLNNGGPSVGFVDVAASLGVEASQDACYTDYVTASWGAAFHDFDNDGWLDLYVSNGLVLLPELKVSPKQKNVLLRHDGASLTFTDITESAGVGDDGVGRGVAFADYDRDGDIDILQVNVDGPPLLLRNDSPNIGNSISVALRGRLSNRDGIGAMADATLAPGTANEVHLLREQQAAFSYAWSELPLHFGIGDAAEVGLLSIAWPSGIDQHVTHVAAGIRLVAVEPLVTIQSAAPPNGSIAEGDDIVVSAILRNHSGQPATVMSHLDLRIPGRAPDSGSIVEVTVAANGTVAIDLTVTVPIGSVGQATIAAEVVASVADAEGGLDESAMPASVTGAP
jgi:enediyne biosynthesis protein E4